MQHFKIFIELTRLNKPIGFMLLFWPCTWGLAYAYSTNNNLGLLMYYLVLFFLGSVFMRSAGCIFNDIVDKDFDIKVKRTNVAILMVEQNAKQALNISDRGYVLVTGENKYNGTGKELLNDPRVRSSFLGG